MEIFISQQELADIVQELGAQISRDYAGKRLLLVGVLKGAFVFLADLARALTIPCEVDFVTASSYRDGTLPGAFEILQDLSSSLQDYDVLVVDDILDSGNTLSVMLEHMKSKNPRSLELCALLDKPSRRVVPVQAKYVGRQIPDAFVVGYGLDYAQQYRHLPHIAVLTDENN
ncbi:MAG: hypoxanthine phosphoribosyltransferase [Oscillospiraceae bacterium]|jgi:hypoxanthine phosphoribosyltransferase|nr:hypoxanthine phosphoribosyltransferase [Oscillospiraceae bacterium]